jgi:phosphatidylglycerophosphate synthase
VDRRPLATRERRWARSLARRLAGWGWSPNFISVAGLVAGVIAGGVLAATAQLDGPWDRVAWALAAGLVQLRLLANMLDGMVALESGRASPLGELYNEVPDRLSDAAILIGLGYAAGGWQELGYLAAWMSVMTAYVRAVGRSTTGRQEFCGPMAKPQRMFAVTVVGLLMALGPAGWRYVTFGERPLGLPAIVLAVIVAGGLLTCVRRLARICAALRAGEAP